VEYGSELLYADKASEEVISFFRDSLAYAQFGSLDDLREHLTLSISGEKVNLKRKQNNPQVAVAMSGNLEDFPELLISVSIMLDWHQTARTPAVLLLRGAVDK
jgi:predicted PP-loop superfamily ATPase